MNERPTLFWTITRTRSSALCVAATSAGVCYAGVEASADASLAEWAAKHFPGSPLVQDDTRLQPYADELIEYLQGTRSSFTAPLDLRGTPFQIAVWHALREIPYGETRSYSDIAHRIGKPAAVRAVGAAIGANPVLIRVPCHRVIGKDGSLTGFREGLDLKRQLLELEGARAGEGKREHTPLQGELTPLQGEHMALQGELTPLQGELTPLFEKDHHERAAHF